MIAGLETPTSGRITIDGVPVFDSQKGINVSANKRKVGFLFQNYALWPNMTVYQNISFGLTNIKEEMDEIDFNARTAARMIEILQKPQDVVRAINECVDKKKKLNLDKAYLRLIDLYEISLFTAKTLMGMKLQEAGDPKAAAAQEIKKLEGNLAAAKAKAEKNGCTLSDDYTLMKGGKPVRSMRKMTAEEIDLIVRRVSRIVILEIPFALFPAEKPFQKIFTVLCGVFRVQLVQHKNILPDFFPRYAQQALDVRADIIHLGGLSVQHQENVVHVHRKLLEQFVPVR